MISLFGEEFIVASSLCEEFTMSVATFVTSLQCDEFSV